MRLTPEVNLIKIFGINLLTLVCKLDLFTALRQLLLEIIKRYNLQKSMIKFMPKKFYEINPR